MYQIDEEQHKEKYRLIIPAIRCTFTCSTLGICAERNAIFNMITSGESMDVYIACK